MDMALVNRKQKRLSRAPFTKICTENCTVLSLCVCCNGMELMSPDWYTEIFYNQRPHSATHCQLSSITRHTWSLILSIVREKQKLSKWFVSAKQQANDNKPARNTGRRVGIPGERQCCVCSFNLDESKR